MENSSLKAVIIGVICIVLVVFFQAYTNAETGENNVQQSISNTQQLNHDEQVIKVNLITPLQKTVSTESDSVFVDLLPEAVKIGMAEAQLKGQLNQQVLEDGTTRMSINWHSLCLPTNDSMLIETLDTPLTSQFRTDGERVEPGTVVTAVGDLDSLIEKFLLLKERANADKTPKHLVEKEEENEDDNNGLAGGDTSTPNTSSSFKPGEFNTEIADDPAEFAEKTTSTWESCDPRISLDDKKVYLQHKQVTVNDSGDIVATGECIDTGETVDIVKEYGEPCNVVYDFDARKAYEQYREYAVVKGETIDITGCSNDFEKSFDIFSEVSDCGVRHDFTAGVSYEQVKLYYTDNEGSKTQITNCIDSGKSYAHFLTDLTCSPYIDETAGKVFEYYRTAYRLDDGSIEYASECRVQEGDGFDLQEAYCEDQKYEHDFTAGQSFYRTYDYYINDDNEKIILSDCSRSTAVSFPHIYKTDSCGVENNDENLTSIQKAITVIETPDDGTIELAPCQAVGPPVPYLYLGSSTKTVNFTSSGTWTVPPTIKNITVFLIAGGGRGGESGGTFKAQDGFGNGGSGGTWQICTMKWPGGGGGGAGEQVTQNVTVTPGQSIPITIGSSNQNSYFGNLVTADFKKGARGQNGDSVTGGCADIPNVFYGGNGANGYGSAVRAAKGTSFIGISGGSGGVGYGAGGGGGGGDDVRNPGGAGAPGYCKITYTVNEYRRGDDTIFKGQP